MDVSEMRELLQGYLSEIDWSQGATRADMVSALVGRDDALATLVNEYIPDGTYADANHVMTLIPEQAWQDAQGDAWRGPTSLDPADVPTHFRDGPVGQDNQ